MKLQLVRKHFSPESTIGELLIDDAFACFTLEDAVRPVKVAGKTAIPAGTYAVTVTFSQRFQKPLPLLNNVPNFEGVRIHAGNRPEDTEGCILVGTTKGPQPDFVGNSRVAFDTIFPKIRAAAERDTISIEIIEQRN